MRDVDFLLAARTGNPLPLDRPLVYRYRSGALRPRMIATLRRLAAGHGLTLWLGAPPLRPGFDRSPLFPSQLLLFDWPARTTRPTGLDDPRRPLSADALQRSLELLAKSLDGPGVHLLEHASPVARHPGWAAVERGALVLEEPDITHGSLPSVLRCLAATTDLTPDADLLGQRGFFASFAGLVEERADLPAVIQAFDERVLLCTDPETHRYDAARDRRNVVGRRGRRALLYHLRDLTALRRECDLDDLLCGLDERRAECGWSSFHLVADLYRLTSRLLEPASHPRRARLEARSRVAAPRLAEGAALWVALLLAWEDALIRSVEEDRHGYRRGPDLIVPALAGLGRDFLAREERAEAGDPLKGRWAGLARALSRCGMDVRDGPGDPLASIRNNLVRALAAMLARLGKGPDWFGHLHEGAAAACVRLDEKARRDAQREDAEDEEKGQGTPRCLVLAPPPSPLHQTFATVIGREHAVAELRRHARARTDGVDLLLHGPDGVGKRTLAWSYARMVLCTQPSPGGGACGACRSCRAFEAGQSGCIEIDGAHPDIDKITQHLVKRVQTAELVVSEVVLPIKQVFVIHNADRYPPAMFDRLLKPMEDSGRARFVLLARDRRAVRLAGQSRCFDYRVRPLRRSEAKAFLEKHFDVGGRAYNAAMLELVIDASEGRPDRLRRSGQILAGPGPLGLADMCARLGLDWAESFLRHWPAIVAAAPWASEGVVDASGVDRSGLERAERVRRVRAVLQLVHIRGIRQGSSGRDAIDPALRHCEPSIRDAFTAVVHRQAVLEGVSAETVWARMVETWLSDCALMG
ncbi:hypothetical protein LRS73_08200 [Methylobacterium currus]|uniref:hypothetical protein n=1 Tax=Methylobacterium currus TaxID=2051553 RepID=UPI001E393D4B|nr:hypothetical protein [Methylobacterium currus]UHC17832.1 hypothetical protein LRS73_08200 [Methylobacterium currus]